MRTGDRVRVYVFHGLVPYGVRFVAARSLQAACDAANVEPTMTYAWLEEHPSKGRRIGVEVLEEGEPGEYAE